MNVQGQTVLGGLRVQRNVVRALFHREIKTRFSGYRLGIFWAVLEPLAHIAIFTLVFGMRGRIIANGIDYPVFLITGFIPFFLFTHTTTQVMKAAQSNQGLFGFRQVRPIDTMLARTIVEAFLSVLGFLTLALVFGWAGYNTVPHDLLGFVTGWMLTGAIGLGLGMIFCAMVTIFSEFEKFATIGMRILYFLSGVMYSLQMIPQPYRPWFLWNPVLHGIDQVRQSFFYNYPSSETSLTFTATSALALLFTGFSLYSIHWKEMIRS